MTTIEVLKRLAQGDMGDIRVYMEDCDVEYSLEPYPELVTALTDAIRQLDSVNKIIEFCNCRDVTPCYTKDAQIGFDTAKDMMLDRLRWAMEEREAQP